MFIHDVCAAFDEAGVLYAIVGGYAVALHGAFRGTTDIDIALHWTLANLEKAAEALKKLGLVSSIPVDAKNIFHFREEYIQNRNLIAWNFYNPSNPLIQIDIIIAYNLKDKKQTKIIHTHSGSICILAKDELIKMKKQSGRQQDLEDIKALESL